MRKQAIIVATENERQYFLELFERCSNSPDICITESHESSLTRQMLPALRTERNYYEGKGFWQALTKFYPKLA